MLRLRAANAMFMFPLCFGVFNLVAQLVAGVAEYSRQDFPPDFIFGASTSAYQVEGAAFEDGRKPSMFDTYVHSGNSPSNGDTTCDQYHKYKEDVQLMVETGLDAYRFSISWSRLIPESRGPINPKGLEYYNNLINELISKGIQPHVTLVHYDSPQALEDEYGGCLSPKFIEDFAAYADVCFEEFGDRVSYWTTFNEANMYVFGSYDLGIGPPARCSSPFGFNCKVGNSTTEPYLAAHNLLLAHASAARLYKDKYQAKQHGYIGLNVFAYHYTPLNDTIEDIYAAQRSYDFFLGWFMHPLSYGDYPEIMRRNAGTRLPVFSKNESELVKGSYNFIGLNYYNPMESKSVNLKDEPRDFMSDVCAEWLGYDYSTATEGISFPITPWGLQGALEHLKQVYNNPPIFVHENGQVTSNITTVKDSVRVEYLQSHIGGLLKAVRNGSNTKGYFVWSFLDVFELLFGYQCSFGLYYVDFNDPKLTRYPKLSQRWYSSFLKGNNLSTEGDVNQDRTIGPLISALGTADVNFMR